MRAPLPAGCFGEERACTVSGLSKPGSAHSAQKHGFLRRNRQHVGPRPPLAPASSVQRLSKTISTSHCRRRGPRTIAAQARGDDRLHPGGGAVGLFRELKDAVTAKINQMDGLWDRFWPMTILFCLMTFVNTLIDSLKDTLVITATNGGPEVIPWMTVYAVFPFSVLFLIVYAAASQRHSRGALFNSIIAVFLSFFAVFGFILYPAHEQLHAVAFADAVEAVVPVGFAGLIGMVRNWTFTLFYCVSELWGDVGLSLLFWGLANDTTSMKHAPLLYPVFGIGANIAQILAGQVLSAAPRLTHGAFAKQLQFIMGLVLCVGVLILCLHRHIEGQAKERKHRKRLLATRSRPPQVVSVVAASTQTAVNGRHANGANGKARSSAVEAMSSNGSDVNGHLHDARVLSCSSMVLSTDPTVSLDEAEEELHRSEVAGKAKKKPKVNIGQAIGMVMKQRSVRDLAVMAVAQGLCSCLMEFSWKSHLRIMLPTPSAYSKFMGEVATTTGMVTVGLMMASPLLFDRYGWGTVAGATPRLLMVVGTLFFLGTVVYQVLVERGMALLVQHQLLYGLSIAGALLYVMSRSAKFSLFKPAEEMVYISLNEDARTKGKAAVDVVGAQLGKSSASLMQQVLLLLTAGSLLHCLPVMTVVFFGMSTCWLSSVEDIASTHHPQKQAPGDDALLDDTAFWEPADEGQRRHHRTDGGAGRGLGDALIVEGAC